MYRRPDSKNLISFFPELNLFLSSIVSYLKVHKEVYILSDMNINLMDKNSLGSKLVSGFQEYGYTQLITEPTHHTKTSHSLIDHIYTNTNEYT